MLIAAWAWVASSSTVNVRSPIVMLSPPSSWRSAVSRASGPLRISRPTSRDTGPAKAMTIAARTAMPEPKIRMTIRRRDRPVRFWAASIAGVKA